MSSRIFSRLAGISEPVGLLIVGLGLLAAAALVAVPASSQAPQTVAGLWLDKDGKARVEIAPCGAEMCGNIVWLKDPLNPKGQPWTDILNPEQSKKSRAICGLQIMGGLKASTNGAWADGWVYDPEEGKSFNLELSLRDANTLTVFGYAGVRLLSETFYWTRQPAGSPRCKA